MLVETSTTLSFVKETMKNGRIQHKSLHRCRLRDTWPNADPRIKRIVAMSDMHGAAPAVIQTLIQRNLIDKDTIVICTGDMGGKNGKLGGLLDPTTEYECIRQHCLAFYFVQGNHDVNVPDHAKFVNGDGTPCYLHGKTITCLWLGCTMAGVSGIWTDHPDESSHKYSRDKYESLMNARIKTMPDVLLTHQPPINTTAKIHLFGHAHADDYVTTTDSSLKLNMDGRVFIWQ
jgi:predicted phosphodiesterase